MKPKNNLLKNKLYQVKNEQQPILDTKCTIPYKLIYV